VELHGLVQDSVLQLVRWFVHLQNPKSPFIKHKNEALKILKK
jgi:hypothetical protein